MKTLPERSPTWILFAFLFGCLCVGCSTTSTVDWNNRIGSYTYDDAIRELGPANKIAKLDDGGTVADWLVERGAQKRVGVGVGTGFSSGSVGVGAGHSISSPVKDKYRRLTFDPAGKLAKWSYEYQ